MHENTLRLKYSFHHYKPMLVSRTLSFAALALTNVNL